MNEIKYIYFHNNTDLPIMIDSWVDNSNRLHSLKVNPREKLIIHSNVGEWHLHSMFDTFEEKQIWKESGLGNYTNIGKFRSHPSFSGDYSWLDYEHIFECTYSEIQTSENSIKGLIVFSQK